MNFEHVTRFLPEEKVVFVMRRHPVSLVGDLTFQFILGVMPVGVYVAIGRFAPVWLTDPVIQPVLTIVASGYYLCYWLFLMLTFTDYYLDYVLITTERIVHVEQRGLFSRMVSELDISRVQDVTSDSHGIVAFVFGYGTVLVQTAGEQEKFIFEQIPHAEKVRERILDLVEEDRHRDNVKANS
ncbi:MAG: PH domain-containing protein [Patescibacteria group bacterium]|nr:PH domain-containing protein [Patescibacteria group bacterium]